MVEDALKASDAELKALIRVYVEKCLMLYEAFDLVRVGEVHLEKNDSSGSS